VWRCAFKLLLTEELPENGANIPYAKELITIIGSERSESRRDPDKLCDLISLIAWIRRFQKPKEERGTADLADLYIALQVGLDAIRETMSGLSEKETQILSVLIEANKKAGDGKGVSIRTISEETKIPYKTVYRILEDSLLEKGYATVDKEGNRNFYSSLSEKTNSSFPFSEGRNEISSDSVISFVSGVIRNFSPSHGNTKAKIFLVDPVTGKSVTFENGSFKVENFLPSESGEKLRSDKSDINKALNSERGTKTFLPEEKGEEKTVFYVKKVKPAEPCEECGLSAVEYEVLLPNGEKVRKCQSCFEKFRRERKVEWREQECAAKS
jgi:predicted transcriptional regulator